MLLYPGFRQISMVKQDFAPIVDYEDAMFWTFTLIDSPFQ
jgi:hypothetical protein